LQSMDARTLKQKYLSFFESKGHAIIPSASLVPENDPTVLFTTAGMHPLIPFLTGTPHPLGKRVVNVQKCLRTQDIDEVGDATHTTCFEMLGNWSFGDYFKKEAIEWSWEFLTSKNWLGLDPERIAITCFKGDKDAPKDDAAADIWRALKIPEERITFLGKKDNWWGPAGETGPCGPDTEMFYWKLNDTPAPKNFDPDDENWVEIWNDVFMQYDKQESVLLIDGMGFLYDEEFTVNKTVDCLIKSFPGRKILTVNANGDKAKKLVDYEIFTFEKEIMKDNPDYFKKLMGQHNLVPEQLILIDHAEENLCGAHEAGITKTLLSNGTNPKEVHAFIKNNTYSFIPLKQKSVDTGLGVERVTMTLQGKETIFDTELFQPLFKILSDVSGKQPVDVIESFRIVADHVRAATFILGDERGVTPSNVDQGYILRRFIRRAIRHARLLGINIEQDRPLVQLVQAVVAIYQEDHPLLKEKEAFIITEFEKEQKKFLRTIEKGFKEIEKYMKNVMIQNLDIPTSQQNEKDLSLISLQWETDKKYSGERVLISSKWLFDLFQSQGMPPEIVLEEIRDAYDKTVINEPLILTEFNKEFEKHQALSRKGAEKKFKGGLADDSEATTKLHTATHLLNEALRKVVSPDIVQRGSNITAERLRFDFSFDRKLTPEERQGVEDEVNRVIKAGLDVTKTEMTPEDALAQGAQGEFGARYPKIVSVYSVGDYSKEICMGPHVKNTKELGSFRIKKEQSSAAGIRRIKAVVE